MANRDSKAVERASMSGFIDLLRQAHRLVLSRAHSVEGDAVEWGVPVSREFVEAYNSARAQERCPTLSTCKTCALWGETESGEYGSCCYLSHEDGWLIIGDGTIYTLPDFGCNEHVPREKRPIEVDNLDGTKMVVCGDTEGVLSWDWDWDIVHIGDTDLVSEMARHFPDDKTLSGKRYRFVIERLIEKQEQGQGHTPAEHSPIPDYRYGRGG
jgi:hypothetical protein